MRSSLRRTFTYPILALGSTVLWGIIEFVALNRRRPER